MIRSAWKALLADLVVYSTYSCITPFGSYIGMIMLMTP